MIYIHGRTAPPRSTFDIYKPPPYVGVPQSSAIMQPMRVPADSGYASRVERRLLKARGHRHGAKGVTLRSHRVGV